MSDAILALDQGTTSSRAILFAPSGEILSQAQQEIPQFYPHSGWVEHDPEAIWQSVLSVGKQVMADAQQQGWQVRAIGLTNQRETTLVWNKNTGECIHKAIVWQDRRTAEQCQALRKQGKLAEVQSRSGLLLDPYFSASKLAWILDNVSGARQAAERGELAFGTIDSFLIWRLTNGQQHLTDVTNASRTNLFNIHQLQWDAELLSLFNVPEAVLPRVQACNSDFGVAAAAHFGQALPILGVAGDQQAAAIGQCCFTPGDIKSTYGTGCFVLVNSGEQALASNNQLLTTLAYQIDGTVHYALEGSIFIAGAAVQWLRDSMRMIDHAKHTQQLAESLDYQHGTYLVPAFAGMGAPYWQANARGALFGLTRGSDKAHLARATLESVAYQTHDLLRAMAEDGIRPTSIKVDGGMVANDWLCQFLADVLNTEVQRPQVMETTALGAAYLAGLQAGVYPSMQQLAKHNRIEHSFQPDMAVKLRTQLLNGWQKAVKATLAFAQ